MKVKTLQKIWIYFVLLNFCILYFDKLTLAYKADGFRLEHEY